MSDVELERTKAELERTKAELERIKAELVQAQAIIKAADRGANPKANPKANPERETNPALERTRDELAERMRARAIEAKAAANEAKIAAWRETKEAEWVVEGSHLRGKYRTREAFDSWLDKQCAKSLQLYNNAREKQEKVAQMESQLRAQRAEQVDILDAKLRFDKKERVVCNIGNQWAAGSIQAIKKEDQKSGRVVPYVVKLDHPIDRMIQVPSDSHELIRAEICFGRADDGLEFTLYSMPQMKSNPKRFQVDDRVVCMVEDSMVVSEGLGGIMWAHGVVTEVEVDMEEGAKECLPREIAAGKWPHGPPSVPYRVQLDEGAGVLVHKDEHWLIRSEELSGGGSRDQRMEVVQHEGCWRKVDHNTCRFRPCDPPEPQ